jgi:hypothetical protein
MTSLRSAADILHEFRVSTTSSAPGRYYAACPQCSYKRKKANQKLKCLGVTIDQRGVKLGCNHCAWTDGAFYQAVDTSRAAPVMTERERADKEKAEEERRRGLAASRSKSQWLWASRKPLRTSIAEIYLRECRGYRGPLPPTLGFLPARDEHPPAMIAAFGMARETEPGVLVIDDSAITGVHITRLRPDGSDKADIAGESAKLTIGVDNRCPIWLAAVNDGLGLVIGEGVEDGLSAHEITGLSAWAAGTANRLPAMAAAVPDYIESITILVDADADDTGEKYSTELAQLLVERGIEVRLARSGDFAS